MAQLKKDRQDPRQNQSLAIRNTLSKMPEAKAADVAKAVESEYGHRVGVNLIYLVKSKTGQVRMPQSKARAAAKVVPVTSSEALVGAIRAAQILLRYAGDARTATAILAELSAED